MKPCGWKRIPFRLRCTGRDCGTDDSVKRYEGVLVRR
jgi:hypothetical protein